MILETLNIKELCGFLINAKRNTFAKDAPREQSKSPLSKNYLYEKGDFRYEDQYFGELLDIGEEIVWYRGIPIWGMGYRGGMKKNHSNLAKQTFGILRDALMDPEPNFPVRGSQNLIDGDYEYINKSKGDITSFTGSELIKKNKQVIYFRDYVGGLIYGKNNQNMKIMEE